MATPQTIPAWSFSRYNDYEKCPFYAKLKFIDKLKEPDNPRQARGQAIHKAAENYVKGLAKTLDPALTNFKAEFAKLRRLEAEAECQWAFDSNWKPVGWFDKTAWCRIKVDATLVHAGKLFVIDYKTGKVYPNHKDQLELYAIGGFLSFNSEASPDIADTQDWYLDLKPDDPNALQGEDFHRKDLNKLIKSWEKKTKAMLTDTKFLPKPADHCRFCHFRKANNGPCKY